MQKRCPSDRYTWDYSLHVGVWYDMELSSIKKVRSQFTGNVIPSGRSILITS